MGFESFYGGRRGASFVIAKNYVDIIAMVTDFAKGSNFSQVKYDEYVLINTINKNHPDNGKLFKRGYDYNSSRTIEAYESINENGDIIINGTDQEYKNATLNYNNSLNAGGAVYIGSIIGPSGTAPFLTIAPYEEVNDIVMSGDFSENQIKTSMGTISEEDLLPGKTENNTYNDDIMWVSASILSKGQDNGDAYIGFKVPYLVTDFIKKDVTPYYNNGNINIERVDDKTHPFYQKWEVAIPPGKHGNGIKNIKKINLSFFEDNTELYTIYQDPEEENPMLLQDFIELGLTTSDDILVYTYQNYENEIFVEKLCYLAEYKQVKNIQLSNDGSIVIAYTNGSQDTLENCISKITKLSYNEDNLGNLKIEYNTGEAISFPIVYPDKINMTEEGKLFFKNNIEDDFSEDEIPEDHILGTVRWINDISYNTIGRNIIITYNTIRDNGSIERVTLPIPFISDLNIEDDGQVKIQKGTTWEDVYYTDSRGEQQLRKIKWIDHTNYVSQSNSLQIFYNSDTDDSPSEVIENVFHKVESIVFRESIYIEEDSYTGPGFVVTYSDGAEEQIPFVTGNLIKNVRFLPGAAYDDVDEGQVRNLTLQITYTNNEVEEIQLDGQLITNIYFINDEITKNINENNEENQTITLPTSKLAIDYDNNTTKIFDNFTYPKTIKIFDDTIQSSHSIVIYDSEGEEIERSAPLNGIESIRIYNNRLLILYNNPTARENIPTERQFSLADDDGIILIWDNLGVVRSDSGILTGKNFTPSQIKEAQGLSNNDELTNEDIILFLNNTYIDGTILNGLYRVITVGQENENKKFYGFNLGDTTSGTLSSWYYLGTIPNSASSQIDMVYGTKEEFESTTDVKKDSLRIGGIFFIIEGEDDEDNTNNSSTESNEDENEEDNTGGEGGENP